MAYPFENETIVEITYTNPERDTIEITWDPNDGIPNNFLTFHGEASDAGLQKWLLANGYTDEVIYQNTRDKNAVDSKNFHQMVSAYAKPFIDRIAAEYEAAYKKYNDEMEERYQKYNDDLEAQYQKYNAEVELRYADYNIEMEERYKQHHTETETVWNEKFKKMIELKDLEQGKLQTFAEVKKAAERSVMKSSQIIEAILKQNKDEEALFKAKLAIFEIKEVKESKDKEFKTAVRKAKTLLELFATINGKI